MDIETLDDQTSTGQPKSLPYAATLLHVFIMLHIIVDRSAQP